MVTMAITLNHLSQAEHPVNTLLYVQIIPLGRKKTGLTQLKKRVQRFQVVSDVVTISGQIWSYFILRTSPCTF